MVSMSTKNFRRKTGSSRGLRKQKAQARETSPMEIDLDILNNRSPLSWSCRLQSRLPDFVGSLRSALTEASIPTNWAPVVGLASEKMPFLYERLSLFLHKGGHFKVADRADISILR